MRTRRIASALLVALVLGLAASWAAGTIMTRGQPSRVTAALAPAQDLMIRVPDGISIAATFRPGRDDHSPAVVVLHGVGASRQATAGNAAWLAGLGYATLAIDFRGHGESDMATRTFGLREALDARAAFDWLKRRQHGGPVAVIGISLDGAASLIGDAGPLPADAMVLQAVYPDIRHAIRNRIATRLSIVVGYTLDPLLSLQAPLRFGVSPSRLSPLIALPRDRGPVLIIGSEQDRSTPPAESRAMFAAANGPRALWLVPHGDHAAICDLADAAYRAHIEGFLKRTMRRPSIRASLRLQPVTTASTFTLLAS